MRMLATADLHGNHASDRRRSAVAARCGVQAIVLAGELLGAPRGFPSIVGSHPADGAAMVDIHDQIHRCFDREENRLLRRRLDELVADLVDRDDERLREPGAELGAQVRDVRVHGAGRDPQILVDAPDLLEQLLA